MTEHAPTPLRDLALGTAMPETEHSPIPWQISDSGYVVAECIPVRGQSLAIRATDDRHGMQDEAAANAAFIVTAVNNHDALVKALTEIRDFPYVGLQASKQTALIAGEALHRLVGTSGDRS